MCIVPPSTKAWRIRGAKMAVIGELWMFVAAAKRIGIRPEMPLISSSLFRLQCIDALL